LPYFCTPLIVFFFVSLSDDGINPTSNWTLLRDFIGGNGYNTSELNVFEFGRYYFVRLFVRDAIGLSEPTNLVTPFIAAGMLCG
jgi:hypothetical protein